MINIQDVIKENTVVHCATEEEANRILKMAHDLGYKWCSGQSYDGKSNWKEFELAACYDLYKGYFYDYSYYKEMGYTIIESTEIMDNVVFKIGDKFKIKKDFNPEEYRKEYPLFVEGMDSFIGKTLIVEDKDEDSVMFDDYCFSIDWIELVEDELMEVTQEELDNINVREKMEVPEFDLEALFGDGDIKEKSMYQEKMSKRFYAACFAMQGLLSNPNLASQIYNQFGEVKSSDAYKITCKTAYLIADELLKQEGE